MTEFCPFISVVICSKGRHTLLVKAVEYVKKCNYPVDKREVVVVEEGEKPNPIEGVKYVYLPLKHRGLGYSRNQGVKNCSGEIIAFTDDDVQVDENWLKEIVAPFTDPAVYGVAGLVRAQKGSILGEVEEILGLPGGGIRRLAESKGEIIETNLLSGCNSAYRRQIFNEFFYREDSFGKFGGDDWYLAMQVSSKYRCMFNPKAVVYHKPRANILKLINTYYRREIHDYLARRDVYRSSKLGSVFYKKQQCVIFRFLIAFAILVIFKIYGLAFLIFFYYLLSILSVRSLFKFVNSKISFFIYPFVKFVTEIGVLKGELLILFCSEKKFNKILENY